MDEPLVRYVRTTDNVSIAYWSVGTGPALIVLPTLLYSHLLQEWQTPEWRRWYELVSRERTVVRYDGRGTGLSQGAAVQHSPSTMLTDLTAVAGCLRGQKLALFGNIHTCAVAVSFAVRHPERVSHLIMWSPMLDGTVLAESLRFQAARKLAEADWTLMSEAIAHSELGWSEQETARRYAALIRASITRSAGLAQLPAIFSTNVWDLLPGIACPTLVMHRPETGVLPEGTAERAAASIPGAQLALLEGKSTAPFLGDWRAVTRTVARFLGLQLDQVRGSPGNRTLRLLSMKSESLTPRERQVVHLLVDGLTNRQIAEDLYLSEKTVANHIGRILVKLDLRSRTQLAAYAVAHGLRSEPA